MGAERNQKGEGLWKQRETNWKKDYGSREKPIGRRTMGAERNQKGKDCGSREKSTRRMTVEEERSQQREGLGKQRKTNGMEDLEDGRECNQRSHEMAEVTEWPCAPTRMKLLSGSMHQLG